ncbi:polyprenyl synthetase family protein [Limoniibacter endophyticus]|uniref:Probable farnesyl diphosphate synthase n=1 Tax=Limoniibacter endophyticus TaxID=1565040 RepID=A0A8J3DRL8_9HYPH|nr:farnesyl diphosphate synthase [Limoniibacter endophyticus]GHC77164.1 (2E,6E)-farnesyl diphosphate synthase [Limoniibacter endophyticus]
MQNTKMPPFETILQNRATMIEAVLREILSTHPQDGEIARPDRLVEAMRHGVLNGGKRLRPFLVLESAALFSGDESASLRVAAALECIHCYSLIHDDLPAMDDDDLRRGRPTVHKAFDDATAILAGDALLTLAFDIIVSPETELALDAKVALVSGLARASGLGGMVGGQMFDMAAEKAHPGEEGIIRLQAMKTGALIRFACEAGAILADASDEDRTRMTEYGAAIGLAFQLADDLLDLTADTATLGKTAGKDVAAGKATLAAMHGPDWTRQQLNGLVAQAKDLLTPFDERADVLRQTADFIANRRN